MKLMALVLVVLGLCGCGSAEPSLAGGKPVSFWLDGLRNADVKVRQKAVLKLGNVGSMDAAVFPALLETLGDADPSVRREAIIALMKFGPGAQHAVPRLTEIRGTDRDMQVRAFAAKALAKLENVP